MHNAPITIKESPEGAGSMLDEVNIDQYGEYISSDLHGAKVRFTTLEDQFKVPELLGRLKYVQKIPSMPPTIKRRGAGQRLGNLVLSEYLESDV
eukprot:CAMPEP_0195297424 /NCGR_PEP_ID=MMETSP0707-20130614/21493_1 /TAXON_ID=33640 /ORGANISM="Asterionellopsis glacialis, Strain CCMP134" /LENGTH=93 /DNA_ID=CAMNT_0040359229 /DNA_START=1 /DNA_END=282 /DNA_ORIENTATION=-